MNAVEIADAVSTLMEQPFNRENFPFAFLEAFGNKETTLKKLRSGDSNKSDLGGVLQRSNIHLKVCAVGEVTATLKALRESPATARLKAKFILATDGETIEAVPTLTEQNKRDLTRCAEDILLAREAHFPATIAELYDPAKMPANLRAAHERNDEMLERIYLGRRFKNDTERLEKLFELYTKMTANPPVAKKSSRKSDPSNE